MQIPITAPTCATPTTPTCSALFPCRFNDLSIEVTLAQGQCRFFCLVYAARRAFTYAALPTNSLPMVACLPPPLHPAVHSPCRPITNKPHPTPLHRHAGQLRYQSTVDPSTSTPPVLLAKGDEAGGFTAGTPLAAYAPETANFTRFVGAGLFGQPGTPCPNSSM